MKKILLNRFVLIVVCFCFFNANSQDLEPRFLSSVPMKTNFAGLLYVYSTGNVLLDNSLPIKDLGANMNTVGAIYARSFKLFSKPAKFNVVVPYTFGTFSALVNNAEASTSRSGFGDPTFRLSIILVGDKPLNIQEFSKQEKKKFNFGLAFKVRPPLGEYDDTKLINLGSNRWGFQLKAASSYWISKKLLLELQIDSWFFTENTSFFNGNTTEQKPLLSIQFHVAYIINPKLWISASVGQVAFGETSVNGVWKDNAQKNSRYGFTTSYRTSKKSSLKFVLTNGLYTTAGSDFTSFLLGYSYMWFDKNKKANSKKQ